MLLGLQLVKVVDVASQVAIGVIVLLWLLQEHRLEPNQVDLSLISRLLEHLVDVRGVPHLNLLLSDLFFSQLLFLRLADSTLLRNS